ncbi:glutamate racemase [Hahella sp. SMD15-11]|uniref:Glutamate racemase n=1 Tax=Thermohahella caldifontis TaxID=3142973 RepID=A0AB39UWE4_9GAMM
MTGTRPPHVAVLDSGAGGLTIVRSIRQRLPDVMLTYVADAAGCPYGERDADDVIRRVSRLARLVDRARQPDILVIACNTASTVVLPLLRARLKIPVVGVVPAIKTAARLTRNQCIGLLATPATIARPYVDALHQEFAPDCRLVRVGSSELVGMAERWLWQRECPATDRLERILALFVESGVDTVVLGCTHFPLLAPVIGAVLGESVTLVDSGDAVARRVESLLGHIRRADSQAPHQSEAWVTQSQPLPVSEALCLGFAREGFPVTRSLLFGPQTETTRNASRFLPQA